MGAVVTQLVHLILSQRNGDLLALAVVEAVDGVLAGGASGGVAVVAMLHAGVEVAHEAVHLAVRHVHAHGVLGYVAGDARLVRLDAIDVVPHLALVALIGGEGVQVARVVIHREPDRVGAHGLGEAGEVCLGDLNEGLAVVGHLVPLPHLEHAAQAAGEGGHGRAGLLVYLDEGLGPSFEGGLAGQGAKTSTARLSLEQVAGHGLVRLGLDALAPGLADHLCPGAEGGLVQPMIRSLDRTSVVGLNFGVGDPGLQDQEGGQQGNVELVDFRRAFHTGIPKRMSMTLCIAFPVPIKLR